MNQTLGIQLYVLPRPSTGLKMFCAGLNVLVQTKNCIALRADPKDVVTAQKLNLSNASHLLVWRKKFGTVTIRQSILAQKIWTSPKYFEICRRTRHI